MGLSNRRVYPIGSLSELRRERIGVQGRICQSGKKPSDRKPDSEQKTERFAGQPLYIRSRRLFLSSDSPRRGEPTLPLCPFIEGCIHSATPTLRERLQIANRLWKGKLKQESRHWAEGNWYEVRFRRAESNEERTPDGLDVAGQIEQGRSRGRTILEPGSREAWPKNQRRIQDWWKARWSVFILKKVRSGWGIQKADFSLPNGGRSQVLYLIIGLSRSASIDSALGIRKTDRRRGFAFSYALHFKPAAGSVLIRHFFYEQILVLGCSEVQSKSGCDVEPGVQLWSFWDPTF